MDLDAKVFTKRGKSLIPSDQIAEEFLDQIKDGREVMITIRRARSPAHHRFVFKMLSRVVENNDRWSSVDELLNALKLQTGLAVMQIDLKGDVYMMPKSVSFAAMDEIAFSEWKQRALDALTEVLGYDPTTLMNDP